jgi:TonB family protein
MKMKFVFLLTIMFSLPAIAQEQVAPTFENCQHIEANGDMQVCFNRTLMEHVVTSLKYPEGLEEEGRVFVEITFDENGQLQEPRVMKSFSELASNEAVKVMKSLPQVVMPATENGNPVAITYTIPVQFKK